MGKKILLPCLDIIMIAFFPRNDHISNTKLEKGDHYYIQTRHKDLTVRAYFTLSDWLNCSKSLRINAAVSMLKSLALRRSMKPCVVAMLWQLLQVSNDNSIILIFK